MIYQAPPTPPVHSQVFIASARNAAQREFDKVTYDAYSNGDGTATLLLRNMPKKIIAYIAHTRHAISVTYYPTSNPLLFDARVIIKD